MLQRRDQYSTLGTCMVTMASQFEATARRLKDITVDQLVGTHVQHTQKGERSEMQMVGVCDGDGVKFETRRVGNGSRVRCLVHS